MKTPEETISYIARNIAYVYYHRPLMYGGTGEGVHLLLHTYHDIWSVIVGRQDEFRKMLSKVHEEEECGSAGFPTRYAMNHPEASERQIAEYVVKQWQKVSERLAVPIPREDVVRELEADFGPREKWQF